MGKPNLRLNPKVEGRVNRQLLELAVSFLFCLLPESPKNVNKSRGRPGWDRRFDSFSAYGLVKKDICSL